MHLCGLPKLPMPKSVQASRPLQWLRVLDPGLTKGFNPGATVAQLLRYWHKQSPWPWVQHLSACGRRENKRPEKILGSQLPAWELHVQRCFLSRALCLAFSLQSMGLLWLSSQLSCDCSEMRAFSKVVEWWTLPSGGIHAFIDTWL